MGNIGDYEQINHMTWCEDSDLSYQAKYGMWRMKQGKALIYFGSLSKKSHVPPANQSQVWKSLLINMDFNMAIS